MQNVFGPKTEIFKVDPKNPDRKAIKRAAEVIRSGGIIVYPTDTIYGFGADVKNPFAMDRLFELKDRDQSKPVSIMIDSLSQAEEIVGILNESERNVFRKLFPGKTTLIFKVRKKMSIKRMAHLHKIGFRIPDNPICTLLVKEMGGAITTTSVNKSGKAAMKSAEEILASFGSEVDLILDAGPLARSKGSTVLDCATMPPTILRQGDLTADKIGFGLGFKPFEKYPEKFIITFVCSGNICRSPMAEGILKNLLSRTKYRSVVKVNSAGTLNIKGASPTIETLDVSSQSSVDLSGHKSRGLDAEIVRNANLIICMAIDHYDYIINHFPAFRSKVILIKQWGRKEKLGNASVADPIGRSLVFYERIFVEISREIKRIFPDIIRMIGEFLKDTGRDPDQTGTKVGRKD